MLMVWFALEISNGIYAKVFMYSMTNLSLCVVSEQSRGGTMEVDGILQRTSHVRVRLHWEGSCKLACTTTVNLDHRTATMPVDDVVDSRGVRKEGVCGKGFKEPVALCCRECFRMGKRISRRACRVLLSKVCLIRMVVIKPKLG
jgi:hypothetical protein